jgi:heme oxygenase (biliverdin-IX-beta and delta-forming)
LSERRDRLRAATAESHAALDAVVSSWRIETPLGYGAFLSASAAAVAPLETALEGAGVMDWLPDWPRRTRRAALTRDLAALGLEPLPFRVAFVPSRDFGAGLDDPPLAYLTHGDGEDLWRSFLAWLEAIPKVGFWTDAAEEGARYGFRCFSDAFERLISPGAFNVRDAAHIRV